MAETTVPTEEQVLARIRQELAEIKVPGAEDAQMDTQWSDLDVDSLDLVELVKALEDEYGIEIHDDELKPIKGVGDAVKLTIRLAQQAA
jgi:acyl carrier protein